MPRVFATSRETALIYNALTEHFKMTGPGEGAYEPGWNDDRIAQEIGPGRLTRVHVASIRTGEFGKLKAAEKVGVTDRIEALEALLHDLTTKYNKLCDTLSVNKVADVRHLKTEV